MGFPGLRFRHRHRCGCTSWRILCRRFRNYCANAEGKTRTTTLTREGEQIRILLLQLRASTMFSLAPMSLCGTQRHSLLKGEPITLLVITMIAACFLEVSSVRGERGTAWRRQRNIQFIHHCFIVTGRSSSFHGLVPPCFQLYSRPNINFSYFV